MWSWVAVVGMLAALVLPGPAMAQEAPPPEGAPVATVTPNADLVDLQAVTVSGTGFDRNDFLDVVQCPSTGGQNNCEFNFNFVHTDSSGSFTHTFGVTAVVNDGRGQDVDCRTAPGTCELRVYGRGSQSLARIGLNFDPDAPRADPPVLAADPTTGLVDGQEIHVTGSGLRPGGYMFVFVCEGTVLSDAACPGSYSAGADDRVDENGDLDTQYRVRAVFQVSDQGAVSRPFEARRTVDCRVSSCFLSAFEDPFNGAEVPVIPLEFDKDAPLAPPPELSVTPSTDLVDGQALILHGSSWFPDESVIAFYCRAGPDSFSDCDDRSTVLAIAGANGTFALRITAQRTFETYDGTTVDCAVQACQYFSFRDLGGEESASAALSFRADPPPPGAPAATPTAVEPRFTG